MNIEILVPSLPESVSDATLATWHKKPGDLVNQGEKLVDLETDKVVLDLPAPETGILKEIIRSNGSVVVQGECLAILESSSSQETSDTQTEASSDTNDTSESSQGEEVPLSPAVRRLVMEKNLDPQDIVGSGKKGRLTKTDILDYLKNQEKPVEKTPAPVQAPTPTPVTETRQEPVLEDEPRVPSLRPEQRVPMTRLRAKVAERLLQAQQNAAMLTTFNEVNMQSVIDLRNQYQNRFQKKHDIKLGFMSFFVKASIEALKKFPAINASIDDNDIIYHGYYDIGIAVSTHRGLIVPVIKDADQLDFAGIEKSIRDFGSKAQEGNLTIEDLTGGTFTITNGGIFGSMLSTPILNPPQCAILGMHAIKERPVVENHEIVIRPVMYLALSYDHRLVDGREAVQFLVTIKECLESPAHLLLNI